MQEADVRINGTLIWYYFICKREVWLIAHGISADQDDENIEIGRFIHENAYSREKKEIDFDNFKVDVADSIDGKIVVQEIKKSSKYKKSAQMQLLFYIYEIKKSGIEAKGILLFPEERKREEVVLDEASQNELNTVIEDIFKIVNLEKPPLPEKCKYCRNCAYSELCWA
ncbi:CRISPR-associated protein Cas4 [Acetivibrio straminisolvens]|jgi:CRISPR-associated exonuclease Cas4|uniref:CRISPR-associated exonuclease Cas4 n=1 Tax=Acetivibrio straminisolvens JCM 21531 TaxID=1294263 RepID=W4V290_9FIRM|nr:CRISPR-associated protein Cas4 [Acetivibrio straminisolvens]GAE87585.1 CRISPR-associated RecB family exonuclease Cas4a [Acetivibrio straminisolvens JCM 21531]